MKMLHICKKIVKETEKILKLNDKEKLKEKD